MRERERICNGGLDFFFKHVADLDEFQKVLACLKHIHRKLHMVKCVFTYIQFKHVPHVVVFNVCPVLCPVLVMLSIDTEPLSHDG